MTALRSSLRSEAGNSRGQSIAAKASPRTSRSLDNKFFAAMGRRNSRDGISGLCAYLLFGRRFQGKASQSDRPRSRRPIFLVDSLFDFADRSCVGRPRWLASSLGAVWRRPRAYHVCLRLLGRYAVVRQRIFAAGVENSSGNILRNPLLRNSDISRAFRCWLFDALRRPSSQTTYAHCDTRTPRARDRSLAFRHRPQGAALNFTDYRVVPPVCRCFRPVDPPQNSSRHCDRWIVCHCLSTCDVSDRPYRSLAPFR